MSVKLVYTIEITDEMLWLNLNGGHAVGRKMLTEKGEMLTYEEIRTIIGDWYLSIVRPYGGVLK